MSAKSLKHQVDPQSKIGRKNLEALDNASDSTKIWQNWIAPTQKWMVSTTLAPPNEAIHPNSHPFHHFKYVNGFERILMDFIHPIIGCFGCFFQHLHGISHPKICENPLISWAAQHARYVSPPPQPAPSRRAAFWPWI
jgi:hypothetical protein